MNVQEQQIGTVFNIQRCSIHDGPGIRTTVFLKGCPLSCPWCHNPESRSGPPQLGLNAARCVGCGACVEACPAGAAAPAGADREACISCGACAQACPSGARELVGTTRTARDLVDEVERDRLFFDTSGGGVTFSGGEPLAQAEFLERCLALCHERGLHTAIDTAAYAPREVVSRIAGLAVLFLVDLKVMDPAEHRHLTGVENRLILDNVARLSSGGADLWIRVPLIPGATDGVTNLRAVAAFVAALPHRHPVFLLPYHDLAEGKVRRFGGEDGGQRYARPDPDEVDAAAGLLREAGLAVTIGGTP